MFLSKLQSKRLLPFLQIFVALCCGLIEPLSLMGGNDFSAPYILGRVKAQATLFEDPTSDQLAEKPEDVHLNKAFSPKVEFNVEILCRWKAYFRVKILTGENTYLLEAEDILFLGKNLIELNDRAWRAVVQENLKGLSSDDPLLQKINTCLEDDSSPLILEEELTASVPEEAVAGPKPSPTKGNIRGKNPNGSQKSFTYGLHRVQEGETLWEIARKYESKIADILDFNKLESHKIRKGQMLRIPRPNSKRPPKYHKVKPGETLWRIAFNNSTSVEALKIANELDSNTIFSGQKLAIPQD